MKPRRVMVMVEYETDLKISEIKEHITDVDAFTFFGNETKVIQFQANVVQQKKPAKKAKKR
jgi:hypothetical protein